jgi:hypothetical protein
MPLVLDQGSSTLALLSRTDAEFYEMKERVKLFDPKRKVLLIAAEDPPIHLAFRLARCFRDWECAEPIVRDKLRPSCSGDLFLSNLFKKLRNKLHEIIHHTEMGYIEDGGSRVFIHGKDGS